MRIVFGIVYKRSGPERRGNHSLRHLLGLLRFKIHIHPAAFLRQPLCFARNNIYAGRDTHTAGTRHKEYIARTGIAHAHLPHTAGRHTEALRVPLLVYGYVVAAPLHPLLWQGGKGCFLGCSETTVVENPQEQATKPSLIC